MRYLRAGHHSLCGCTACVDAGSAKMVLIDERHFPTQVRKTVRKRPAALSRADDNRVVLHRNSIGVRFCNFSMFKSLAVLLLTFAGMCAGGEPFRVKPYLQLGDNPSEANDLAVLWQTADH